MSDHEGNRREHSLLCLTAIYAIHVVLFHVFLPPKLSVTKITIASKFDESFAISRTHSARDNETRHSAFLMANVTSSMRNDNSEILKKSFNSESPKLMEAIAGQFPQQVSIKDLTEKHMCSGNIIHKDWILTDAHCMCSSEKSLSSENMNVRAGDVRLGGSFEFSERSEVLKIYVHKYYDNETMENDVALLQLKSSLLLDDLIVSAVRLRNADVPVHSTECSVAGWKVGSPNNQSNDDALSDESVGIVQRDMCGAIYYEQSRNTRGIVCAKHADDNGNTCLADTGAGAASICGNGLTAILMKKNCSFVSIPSLYMDVRLYVDWIKEITNLTTSYDGKSFDASMTSTSATSSVNSRNFSPTALGIFLGCLAFLLTFTDHERAKA